MTTSFIILILFTILAIASLIQGLYNPKTYIFFIAVMIFYVGYLLIFYKKYTFTDSMYRLLDSPNPHERIAHLYYHFSVDIEFAENKEKQTKRFPFYPKSYNNDLEQKKDGIQHYSVFGEKMELKIVENLYRIYNSEEQH